MPRFMTLIVAAVLVAGLAGAEEPAGPAAPAKAPPGKPGDKVMSGMSIVGNDEAPKSLVIVPWKGSELGDSLDVSRSLDDGMQPVDREVFMRELTYYQIRTAEPDPDESP